MSPWNNVCLPVGLSSTDFVDMQNTFMTAGKLIDEFDVFCNSDVRNDLARPLPFPRSRASKINFL